MRKWFVAAAVLLLQLLPYSPVFAVCPGPPGSTWVATWTDLCIPASQTTYTLEAPCKVFVDTPFSITATVIDNDYPDGWVASVWSITDNGAVIPGQSGFSIDTAGGLWQRVIPITYTGTPIDHEILFNVTDVGCPSGGHMWGSSVIGDITLDPYPPGSYQVKRTFGEGIVDYDMYPSDAYAKVDSDDQVILCKTGQYAGVLFDKPYAIFFAGGYDTDFTGNAGNYSTIASVELSQGSVTLENISIQ